jgi:hypothetical protein
VERHQESRLLTLQVVLLAFFGGFLIDVLASSVYDLLVSIESQLTAQVTVLRMGIVLTSIIVLIIIFWVLRKQLLRYKPPQPILSFLVTPEDTMPFLQESEFQSIEEYLKG